MWGSAPPNQRREEKRGSLCNLSQSGFEAVPYSLSDETVCKVLLLKIIDRDPFYVGTTALVLCGLGLGQSSGGTGWQAWKLEVTVKKKNLFF